MRQFEGVGRGGEVEEGEDVTVGVEGVAGEVEAGVFAFVGEAQVEGPVVERGRGGRFVFFGGGAGWGGRGVEGVEEGGLAAGGVALGGGGGGQGGVYFVEEGLAGGAEGVEGAGFDEGFEGAFVEVVGGVAAGEVGEGGVGAVGEALLDGGLHGALGGVFDGGQAVADGAAIGGELGVGVVDVGGEDGDAGGFGVEAEGGDFFEFAADFAGEQGAEEFCGVVGFEPGGAVGEDAVGGGVGFVEAVAGEFFQEVEDAFGLFAGDAVVVGAAFDEFDAFFGHFFGVFFAHGAAQEVGAAEAVAGQEVGGAHDLFLVDHDAVGVGADVLEEGVFVGDLDVAVAAADEVGDQVHGPGAVEGDEGDDVVDVGELELAAEVAHAWGFELEDARGAALVEEGEGGGVVVGEALPGDGALVVGLDELFGLLDDGEGLEAEEVHLE